MCESVEYYAHFTLNLILQKWNLELKVKARSILTLQDLTSSSERLVKVGSILEMEELKETQLLLEGSKPLPGAEVCSGCWKAT